MSAKDSPLVEYAPWILKALGVVFILADGPLPFGDAVGWILIGYGSALQASYTASDVAVWAEAHWPSDSDSTDPGDLVHLSGGSPIRTDTQISILPDRHSSRNPRRWCNRHARMDTCYKY